MACYCDVSIRYKGRLIEVGLRYCSYNGFAVIRGKKSGLGTKRDIRKIIKLANREFKGCPLKECACDDG